MRALHVNCRGCGRDWGAVCGPSLYERVALESRPCPHCEAYTLYVTPPADRAARPTFRRVQFFGESGRPGDRKILPKFNPEVEKRRNAG